MKSNPIPTGREKAALRSIMGVNSGREQGLCFSVSLWLGQSIAVPHRGTETRRISNSSSPIPNGEEPRKLLCLREFPPF